MESQQYSHVNINSNDDGTETLYRNRRGCLCFTWNTSTSTSTHPSSTSGLNWWQRIRTSDFKGNSLLSRGVNALKKVREWSEIVAGPRWKTFIRRLNRNNSSKRLPVNYQYDALGYALNFDEGPGTVEESGEVEDYTMRNFSVRYAAIPASVKSLSADLGNDGPSSSCNVRGSC